MGHLQGSTKSVNVSNFAFESTEQVPALIPIIHWSKLLNWVRSLSLGVVVLSALESCSRSRFLAFKPQWLALNLAPST